MNNKGFTLIELLVTIALLAVIASISFVAVTKVIEEGKKNNCLTLINNIKSAASEYVSDHRYKSDFAVTDNGTNITATISANNLITGNYLSSPIINPITGNEIELSSINILVDLNNDYTAKSVTVTGITCNRY